MKKLGFCIKTTAGCLRRIRVKDGRAQVLLKFAKDYFADAQHFAKTDPETALEAVAYAHGFIDAAVLLGFAEIPGYHLQPGGQKA